MKRTINMSLPVLLTAAVSFAIAAPALAQNAMSMDELLRAVEQGRVKDNQENKEREKRFRAAGADQDRLLREARAEKTAEEKRSERLEAIAEKNKEEIAKLDAELNIRLGDLKELFEIGRAHV